MINLVPLGKLEQLIRSKNDRLLWIIFDTVFENEEDFECIIYGKVLTKEWILGT